MRANRARRRLVVGLLLPVVVLHALVFGLDADLPEWIVRLTGDRS
ncbi:MAG TPA: hypothetical protein VGN26_04770 [Armatimonadota bacterium]|jgi:hypothetical protein